MMNNNKILTVSYGTFSCTLEGFDDSFGTMKAIAEYFRDLAADDRYFGAEPPQPDAEMLARIAEREISRRVEAREQEGRIVLSADPTTAPVVPVAAAATVAAEEVAPAATEEAPEQATVEMAEEVTEQAPTETPKAETPEVDLDAIATATESEEPAAETAPEPAAADEPSADTTEAAEAPAPVIEADITDAPETIDASTPVPADEAEADAEDVPALDAVPVIPEADTVALGSVTDAAAPNSIAAKLQRIRAVVSASQEEANDDILFEDEHAGTFPPETDVADLTAPEALQDDDTAPEADTALSDAIADIDAAAEEDAAAADAATAEIDTDEDEIAAALARLDTQIADTPVSEVTDADASAETDLDITSDDDNIAADIAAVADDASDDVTADIVASEDVAEPDAAADSASNDDDDIAATLARLDAHRADEDAETESDAIGEDSLAADLDRDVIADEAEEDAAENLFDDTADAVTEADTEVTADAAPETAAAAEADAIAEVEVEAEAEADTPSEPDTEAVAAAEADAEAAPQPEVLRRARVIKVKRADIEAALAAGKLEEVSDDTDADASSLSPEDEAELQAELDAVTAELPEADEDAEEAVADAHSDDMPPADPVAAMADDAQAANPPVADADVSRLMAEADNQMEEPEGSRRRNAFQHLKAAVMAKKADAGLGRKSEDEEGAFRSDLAEVVVPRRPSAESAAPRVERPERHRAAPLKLVAEQRVDTDRPAPAPVQPRRVVQDEIAPEADASGSFADYAADMGAHSLPELLEAAASYLSFVEGRAQFSRPQLMNKVRQMQQEDFSREDGLRSFGQLLRAGKIEKQQGGRFTVTDDIGYRPDERAAG